MYENAKKKSWSPMATCVQILPKAFSSSWNQSKSKGKKTRSGRKSLVTSEAARWQKSRPPLINVCAMLSETNATERQKKKSWQEWKSAKVSRQRFITCFVGLVQAKRRFLVWPNFYRDLFLNASIELVNFLLRILLLTTAGHYRMTARVTNCGRFTHRSYN